MATHSNTRKFRRSLPVCISFSVCVLALVASGCSSDNHHQGTRSQAIGNDGGLDANGDAGPPPPLQAALSRNFFCDPTAIPSEAEIGVVENAIDDKIVIKLASGECQFNLYYRDAIAGDTLLSSVGAGYIASASLFDSANAHTVLCTSAIQHVAAADPGNVGQAAADTFRYTNDVAIKCAARVNGQWSALTDVVTPGGTWAAWINRLELDVGTPGSFKLRYVRDFSFQFGNVTDLGRPAEDGVYEAVFAVTVDGGGAVSITSGAVTKTSGSVVSVMQASGEPTDPNCPGGVYDGDDPLCGFPVDAGVADAGVADAGVADAGL